MDRNTETVTQFVAPEEQNKMVDEYFYYPGGRSGQFSSNFDSETYNAAYEQLESTIN